MRVQSERKTTIPVEDGREREFHGGRKESEEDIQILIEYQKAMQGMIRPWIQSKRPYQRSTQDQVCFGRFGLTG